MCVGGQVSSKTAHPQGWAWGLRLAGSPGVQGWTVAKARIPQIRARELGRWAVPCGDPLA